MNDIPANILPVSALANVSEVDVKQRRCGLSQNSQAVEFGQLLFVIG
jgi:hypothetical protein